MNEKMQDRALECQSVGTPEVGDGVKTVRLAGWGSVESTRGTFIVDDEAARETITAFDGHGAEVPIDIEHSVLNESLPPEQRGAIGWVTKIFSESGKGLFALVKWSDKGKGLIRSGAFQYLSPVFVIRKADRRVIALHSAAVTTKPAMVRAELLAASQNANAETTAAVNENAAIAQSVRSALGLEADADAQTTLVAMSKLCIQAVHDERRAGELREILAPYVAKGILDPDSKYSSSRKNYAEMLALAAINPELCKRVLDERVASMPRQGRTLAPADRQVVIGKAEREYRDNPGHRNATSLKAFVAQSLRDKGLPALTEVEAATLSVG